MIFCVSPDPYHEIHGSSPEKIRQLFLQLKDIGIGGVNIGYKDPDEHPEWADYIKSVAEYAGELGFRVSMHAPAADISSTDKATRELATARERKAIRDIGRLMDGVIIIVHPENYKPDRHPGDDDARKENCKKSMEELVIVVKASKYDGMIQLEVKMKEGDDPIQFYLRNYQHFVTLADKKKKTTETQRHGGE